MSRIVGCLWCFLSLLKYNVDYEKFCGIRRYGGVKEDMPYKSVETVVSGVGA